jgi:hypothetical protein
MNGDPATYDSGGCTDEGKDTSTCANARNHSSYRCALAKKASDPNGGIKIAPETIYVNLYWARWISFFNKSLQFLIQITRYWFVQIDYANVTVADTYVWLNLITGAEEIVDRSSILRVDTRDRKGRETNGGE